MDRTPEGRPFISCWECNGQWDWTVTGYRHRDGCSRAQPKPYPDAEQVRDELEATREDKACPVHDYEPALECPTCLEKGGDLDYWTPAQEFG